MTLTGVTPEDRAELLDLWVAAWTEAMPSIDFETRRAWFAARLDAHLQDGALLIAAQSETERAILGYALVNPSTGYLDQLAVDPPHKGRGIASSLIAQARERCPNGLELHVNQDNARAVRFYRRHGFTIAGGGINPRSGLPIWNMVWRPTTG
jgi:putative acetyltransferase